mgnify:CR=1 FL=1
MTTVCQCPNCGCRLTISAAAQQQQQPGRRVDGPQPQRPPRQPAPTTAGEAAAYRMPFGKHQGLTLAEVDDVDPDYLAWGLDKWDRDLGRATALFMGSKQPRQPRQPAPASGGDRRAELVAELAAAPAFDQAGGFDDDVPY